MKNCGKHYQKAVELTKDVLKLCLYLFVVGQIGFILCVLELDHERCVANIEYVVVVG